MVNINELSNIGYGGYRIRNDSKENENALHYALEKGCNLIDTASGYRNGESEILIGRVLNSIPDNNCFIISKAGYIFKSNKELMALLKSNSVDNKDLLDLSEDYFHSIHPLYLDYEIRQSLKRLNKKYIDCYLLHNPEYYLEKSLNPSKGIYYKKIKKAFEFLEEQVALGVIRYYGVSSNSLPLYNNNNHTCLSKLIEVANKVSSNNHFKFVQFPYNINEREAKGLSNKKKQSLLSIAKQHNIITLSNRPLITSINKLRIDLLYYDEHIEKESVVFERKQCYKIIQKRINIIDSSSSLKDYDVLNYLEKYDCMFDNDKTVVEFFKLYFNPFIEALFLEDANKIDQNIKKYQEVVINHALKNKSLKTKELLKKINFKFINIPSEELPKKLIKTYLDDGINHVLCGMTKPKYVENLKDLFF